MTGDDTRALHRIVDANLNRAGEALRVLEDAARFGRDDRRSAAVVKSLRHGLREATAVLCARPGIERSDLLASRDTAGDVGTTTTTDAEGDRSDLASLIAAAAGRATEALRSLEEASKALGGDPGFEGMRYRVYDLERDMLAPTNRAVQYRLCVLLTESLCARPWLDVAEAAIRGGADCLQLREKDLPAGELAGRARDLVRLAAGRAAVIVNDRLDIALAANADGVHLGQTDLSVADARRVARDGFVIGCSTSRLEEAEAAADAGADYVGLGPVFPSSTKPKDRLAGLDYVRAFRERGLPMGHLAISGIGATNAPLLAEAGCRGIAVSSAVCGAGDPEAAARALAGTMPA